MRRLVFYRSNLSAAASSILEKVLNLFFSRGDKFIKAAYNRAFFAAKFLVAQMPALRRRAAPLEVKFKFASSGCGGDFVPFFDSRFYPNSRDFILYFSLAIYRLDGALFCESL